MSQKITTEALLFYVPFFHQAVESEERLLLGDLSAEEINFHETQVYFKQLVLDKIVAMSEALIISELNKIISGSHLKYSKDLFDILYYAGLNGLSRGLQKFDTSMTNVSATNYLFQWFTVYAKRELNTLEAPYGIAPSRFQKYKKISAVRKSLSARLQREVSNEEVFQYFQSGAADVKNMNGPLNKPKRSAANQLITLALIEEQEEFESKYMYTQLFDPTDETAQELKVSIPQRDVFDESIFGIFIKEHPVTAEAKAALLSELQYSDVSSEYSEILKNLSTSEYRSLISAWKNLIKDPDGPFFSFLTSQNIDDFTQLDIQDVLSNIEILNSKTSSKKYEHLFIETEN